MHAPKSVVKGVLPGAAPAAGMRISPDGVRLGN
jgi:hypothetical protein